MRLFGSPKMSTLLTKLGLKEDESIVHPWVTKALEKAQQKVEMHNYDVRKTLLQFDDVMNEQRHVIYNKRRNWLEDPRSLFMSINKIRNDFNKKLCDLFIPKKSYREEWDIENLRKEMERVYGTSFHLLQYAEDESMKENDLRLFLEETTTTHLEHKFASIAEEEAKFILQKLFLITLDDLWRDHLHSLERLRTGVNLRAYAQKNPLVEYKMEAFVLFKEMLNELEEQILIRVSHLTVTSQPKQESNPETEINAENTHKIPRNHPCHCGSGKRYKHCHGSIVKDKK